MINTLKQLNFAYDNGNHFHPLFPCEIFNSIPFKLNQNFLFSSFTVLITSYLKTKSTYSTCSHSKSIMVLLALYLHCVIPLINLFPRNRINRATCACPSHLLVGGRFPHLLSTLSRLRLILKLTVPPPPFHYLMNCICLPGASHN